MPCSSLKMRFLIFLSDKQYYWSTAVRSSFYWTNNPQRLLGPSDIPAFSLPKRYFRLFLYFPTTFSDNFNFRISLFTKLSRSFTISEYLEHFRSIFCWCTMPEKISPILYLCLATRHWPMWILNRQGFS